MSDELELVSFGGICAPLYLYTDVRVMKRGDLFNVTVQVEGRLRRWWHRRTGWSTEWVQEHEWVPLTDSLPRFTATRGGLYFLPGGNDGDV